MVGNAKVNIRPVQKPRCLFSHVPHAKFSPCVYLACYTMNVSSKQLKTSCAVFPFATDVVQC